MKIKYNLAPLWWIQAFLTLTVILFTACDKIAEPYLIATGTIDTVACPAPIFPTITTHIKRVLLEDYTGHTCVNCPSAALSTHNLKGQYGDKLVVIAVHAGFFAKPSNTGNYTYDFRTPAGTDWDNYFGIGAIGNPNGMVNRRKINNTYVIAPSGWSNAVAGMVAETPQIDIQIINEYSTDGKKLCTHVQTQFLQAIDKNLKLIVALAEDSIVAPQKNNDPLVGTTPEILYYVHMHALRGTITSTWGTAIAAFGTVNPTSISNSFVYQLADNWIPANCRVVAFVYDDDTKEVLQAAEAKVIN